MRRTPASVLAGVLILAAGATSACSPPTDDVETSSQSSIFAGATFVVGSKDFTESILLGQITMQMLKANGATVVDKTNIKGSVTTREALTSSQIDLYWEYTGTGWISYLKNTKPIPDPQQQFDAVAKDDLAKNQVVWSDRAPLNNTYAMAIRKDKAGSLGVKSLSDVARIAKEKPAEATFCIESEFSTRDDGMPGMLAAYGIDVPKDNIKMLETGVIYTETAKGSTCNFGEVFATDGRISPLNLVVLADDKNFFPVYNAALTMRQETSTKYPKIAELLAPVAQKLTTETMQKLNAEVDNKGLEPADVVKQWLTDEKFLQ
ncbi:glycine betaine ABC transporter substrate-binding protein [Dactylosporangium sp. CA-092794]|uniref:glycine betaine ABC transporter substrate-binding protein n=1 Tax=Dactylosporangium sp. CA-092794 TaxID=3239929 RepID=UPI003D90D51A